MSTFGLTGKIEEELRQPPVVCVLEDIRSIEQNSDVDIGTIRCPVDEICFHVGIVTIECVFGWTVELDP